MTSDHRLRIAEAVLGLFLLALGAFIVLETAQMNVAPSYARIGPKLFPNLVAAGLLCISAFILREAVLGRIAHRSGLELDWGPPVLISVGLIAQMLLLERIGWIASTAILFVCVARALTSRRPVVDAVIGAVLAAICLAVFNWGLGLRLPTGTFFQGF